MYQQFDLTEKKVKSLIMKMLFSRNGDVSHKYKIHKFVLWQI